MSNSMVGAVPGQLQWVMARLSACAGRVRHFHVECGWDRARRVWGDPVSRERRRLGHGAQV